jgi:hypothetical protein
MSSLSKPPAKHGRIRLGAVLLFLAGIAGFLTVPFFLERAAPPPPPEANLAGPSEVRPIQVRTPDGQIIGWLQISYPESIRQNEEQQLDVKYIGDKGKWGRVKDIASMSVLIQAANLGLFPEPFEYRFNLARIVQTGEDSHVWTVSPKQEGDYRLLVKFNVEPETFTVLPVAVNGVDVSTNGETSLPVRVNTRYDVPQAWIDVLKALGYVLSFILTLPLLKTFVERYWNRARGGVSGTGA